MPFVICLLKGTCYESAMVEFELHFFIPRDAIMGFQ
jgi:hypothetical protein